MESDNEKEKKQSQDRRRIKEIWQLDYVRKNVNSTVIEKKSEESQSKPTK